MKARWITTRVWLVAIVLLCCGLACAQDVTLTGTIQGANGLPASNNTISFTPTQNFYVPGTNTTQLVDNVVSNQLPTGSCAISGQFWTYTGTTPPALYQCQYGVWVTITTFANYAFSAITGAVNTSAAMVCGTGCSISTIGAGTIAATSVGGITVTGTPSAGQILKATGPSTATWGSLGASVELQTGGVDNGSQTLLNLVSGAGIQLLNSGGNTTITELGPVGAASGDLSGSYPGPNVVAIRGKAVSVISPTNGQVLTWNSTTFQYEPVTALTAPSTTGVFAGDGSGGIVTATPAQVESAINTALWVDASDTLKYTGDFSQKLSAAMMDACAAGIGDVYATGPFMRGTQTASIDPFLAIRTTYNVSGAAPKCSLTVHLPSMTTVSAAVQWVQPSSIGMEGQGSSNTGTVLFTLRGSSSFPANTALLSWGMPEFTDYAGTIPPENIYDSHIALDCSTNGTTPITGCIGLANNHAQENSWADDILFLHWTLGFEMEKGDSHAGPITSGPYTHFHWTLPADVGTEKCFDIGTNLTVGSLGRNKGIMFFSCNASGTTVPVGDGGTIGASNTVVEYGSFEGWLHPIGVNKVTGAYSQNVVISNIDSTSSGYATSALSIVDIGNANSPEDINVFSVYSADSADLITDANVTAANKACGATATRFSVGYYSRINSNRVLNDCDTTAAHTIPSNFYSLNTIVSPNANTTWGMNGFSLSLIASATQTGNTFSLSGTAGATDTLLNVAAVSGERPFNFGWNSGACVFSMTGGSGTVTQNNCTFGLTVTAPTAGNTAVPGPFLMQGYYSQGSTSAVSQWQLAQSIVAGTNGLDKLTLSHTGDPNYLFQIPNLAQNVAAIGVVGSTVTFTNTSGEQYVPLNSNVTSSTVPAGSNGQSECFWVTQTSPGGYSFAWPTNTLNAPSVNMAANSTSGGCARYFTAISTWVFPTMQYTLNGSAPTMVAGPAAGTSPTCTSISGANMAGVISCATGTSPSANATLATITFSGTVSTVPQGCSLFPRNNSTPAAMTTVYTTAPTTTGWSIAVGAVTLGASTTYSWSYQCL